MNRIVATLEALKEEGRKALITYIVNGDPYPEATLPTMHTLVAEGADIIELGVAFSDPMAEGPVIQRGHERALAQGTSLQKTLSVVHEFRKTNSHTPIVLMGYLNPIERMGYEHFAKQAKAAGVDGLLIVDFPPEEAVELNRLLKQEEIKNIFLLAPTTTAERIGAVARLASGFIYYVSLKGVTGAGNLDAIAVERKLNEIREFTDLPLMVGFGIKDADSARAVAQVSDGAVVGSVLVDAMGAAADKSAEEIAQAVATIVSPIRTALNAV